METSQFKAINSHLKSILKEHNSAEKEKAAKELFKIFDGIKSSTVLHILKHMQEDITYNSVVSSS